MTSSPGAISKMAAAAVASSAGATCNGRAAGSSSGARAGRPIPKPGIAALPQASSGEAFRMPAARASATFRATSGSSRASVGSSRSAVAGSSMSWNGTALPTIVTMSPGASRRSS